MDSASHHSSSVPHVRPASGGKRPAVAEGELRAILSVCDSLVARAGRTTLALALRGSRSKRVLQHEVESAHGYGFFAGVPEAEVLARIDALIADGVLCIEYHDGFPLLGYTDRGLQLAMRFAAEKWLVVLRTQVPAVAAGAVLALPPVLAAIQQRNQATVLLLAERIAHEADATWLPLLRAWSEGETRRVRGKLAPIIAALEGQTPG
jgi:hypothetical protein